MRQAASDLYQDLLSCANGRVRTCDARANYSAKLTRSFRRDEESEWEMTEYLSTQDLLLATRLSRCFHQSSLQYSCTYNLSSLERASLLMTGTGHSAG
jgi:hypothetical protein